MSVGLIAERTVLSARFALPGLARQLPTMIAIAKRTKAPHPALQPLRGALIDHFDHGDQANPRPIGDIGIDDSDDPPVL